ncbi:MAG TPA: M56 family metallopeptidase [Chthonomonadaceae bacterium]|nr:M56 family metallopeptidase [Chthonomonadaceae bacterium]
MLLWQAGVWTLTAQLLAALWRVARLQRRCRIVTEGRLADLVLDVARTLGVRRPVVLRMAPERLSVVPMTWGVLRPVVLLPALAEDWTEERLRVVLLHEMAHVRRGDWLTQRLAQAICLLYWFHPPVWLLARRLRIESERACDDCVLSAGVPAVDYARHLLAVVRTTQGAQAVLAPTVAMAQASQIEQRLRAILAARRDRRAMTRRMLFLALGIAAAALLPLATVRPESRSPLKKHTPKPPPSSAYISLSNLSAPEPDVETAGLRAASPRSGRHAVRPVDLLVRAAKRGEVGKIAALLAQGVNINGNDSIGNTALTEAAYYDRTQAVRYLLDHGADLNATSNSGWTALAKAVKHGSAAAIHILLERGAYANAVRKQLQARYGLLAAAYTHRSERVYRSLLMPDFTGTALDGSTQTRPQALMEWSRLLASGPCLAATFSIDRLTLTGEDATVRGHIRLLFAAPANGAEGGKRPVALIGSFEDAWTQTASGWRMRGHRGALVNEENRHLALHVDCAFRNAVLTGLAQFSPRDPVFAVLAHDGSVWIFDTAGRLLRKLIAPGEQMTALAYSPDGRRLMTGTRDGKVRVWDVRTGASQIVFVKPGMEAARVAWLPGTDRGILGTQPDASTPPDRPDAFVFSLTTGQEVWAFASHISPDGQGLAVSPDGRCVGALAPVAQDREALLLDAEHGTRLAALGEVHSERGPLSVAFAPGGTLMATGCAPSDVLLWDRRRQEIVRVLKGHRDGVVALAFSPDGRMLVSGANDRSARVWDVRTGQELGRILFDADSNAAVLSVSFSPDGKRVLAVTDAGGVLLARAPRLP